MESEPTGHLLAVMAHSLLNSVAAIKTATSMLADRERLTDAQVDTIIGLIGTQSDHLHVMLKDLVRTGDPALMATLDGLGEQPRVPSEDRSTPDGG